MLIDFRCECGRSEMFMEEDIGRKVRCLGCGGLNYIRRPGPMDDDFDTPRPITPERKRLALEAFQSTHRPSRVGVTFTPFVATGMVSLLVGTILLLMTFTNAKAAIYGVMLTLFGLIVLTRALGSESKPQR